MIGVHYMYNMRTVLLQNVLRPMITVIFFGNLAEHRKVKSMRGGIYPLYLPHEIFKAAGASRYPTVRR